MSNKIEFKIFADAKDLEKGLSSTKRQFDALGRGSALAFGGLTASIFGFTKAADSQRKALAAVDQAIQSTGGAAGRSLDQLKEKAKSLQSETLFEEEVILRNATTQLLTFTNIAEDNFDRVQMVALDVSTVLDTTGDGTARLKDVSIQLGKALNDPVQNLSALSRAGIQFSDSQEKTIKTLAQTNRLSEAQALILTELERQYGGQARAAREADSGLGSLKNSLGDLAENIGQALLPTVQRLTGSIEKLSQFLENNPGFASASAQFLVLGAAITGVLASIGFLGSGVISAIGLFAKLGKPLTFLVNKLPIISALLQNIALVGAAAFIGWKIGERVAEIESVQRAIESLARQLDLFGLRTNEEILANAEAANKAAVLRRQLLDDELLEKRAFIEQEKEIERQKNEELLLMQQEADILKIENLEQFQEQVRVLEDSKLEEYINRLSLEKDALKSVEEQKTDILKNEAVARQALRDSEQKGQLAALDFAEQMTQAFGKESKAAFYILKALRIGEILVNSFAAAMNIRATWAWNPPVLAALLSENKVATFLSIAGVVGTTIAGSFAVGASRIPQDMTASIHRGEMIIPETFSDAIRSGELSLSGSGGGGLDGGGIRFDFSGATLNGVTEDFVKEIFTKASESIVNKTLVPLPA